MNFFLKYERIINGKPTGKAVNIYEAKNLAAALRQAADMVEKNPALTSKTGVVNITVGPVTYESALNTSRRQLRPESIALYTGIAVVIGGLFIYWYLNR